MKKTLAIILSVCIIFLLCACNVNDTEKPLTTNPTGEPTMNENIPTLSDYAGNWKHEKTENEPISMNFTLNEDGTGNQHTFPISWSIHNDGSISISISRGAGKEPEVTTAVLLEDGSLQWNKPVTVKAADGTSYHLDHLIMTKA